MLARAGRPLVCAVVLALLAVLLGPAASPAAATTRQPETVAGVVAAAERVWPYAEAGSSARTAARGIANLFVSDTRGGGGPGCREVWGYTGRVWGGLGRCNQDFFPYPSTLPGRLLICRDSAVTVIRSAPSPRARIVGRVRTTTRVTASQFRLVLAYKGGKDGVGYYRIRWHGAYRWVASYRVVDVADGCSGWSLYWHREATHR